MAGEDARRGSDEAPEQDLLSLDEAAAALDVSRSTLARWLNEGRVRGRKVGRQWRFRRSDLEKVGQMSHPSAAAVNVAEVEGLTRRLREKLPDLGDWTITPTLADYPSTEEEKAVDQLFQVLVVGALLSIGSDVHIDPRREEAVVSYRVDGVLQEMIRLPRPVNRALTVAIKAHSDMALDLEQVAQDGRFGLRGDGGEYDYRVATMPALYGESVAMRILNKRDLAVDLDRLGMTEKDQYRYLNAFMQPNGLILVVGPTGSGKTTVLYSGLKRILSPSRRVHTVEDPVESMLEGATQIPVNRRTGMTMEYILRMLMRHDPDVVVVSEIADQAVGESCLQLAVTGHLVLASVHATSAAGTITRLLDLGLDPFMLTQSLVAVVGTRLARLICPQCGQPETPPAELLAPYAEAARRGGYEIPADATFRRGAGCDHCWGYGYRGRTGLFEVMEMNEEINRLILARASAETLQEAAVRNGMTTIVADGIRKAAEGITTLAEAVRVTRDLAV